MTYEESNAINFSKLSALLEGVDYYKKITTEDIGRDDQSMAFGSACHTYFLENEFFDDRYIAFVGNKPSNAKHKEFCYAMSDRQFFNEESRVMVYSSIFAVKSKKEAVIVTESTSLYIRYKEYIEFLKRAKNRLILDSNDMSRIKTYETKFKRHKGLSALMYQESKSMLAFNELEIFFRYKGEECKAKLDRLVVDTKEKVIFVIDIKTHATKNLRTNTRKSFRQAMYKYNYHMQQAFYTIAMREFVKQTLKITDYNDYKVYNVIIILQSNFLNTVKLVALEDDDIYEGLHLVADALKRYTFHGEYGFDYDMEYYDNELGFESLK